MKRTFLTLLFGALGLAVLLYLGIWQIQRLTWKQDVLAQIEARIADAPARLPATPDPERDRYMPVQVDGQIVDGELHVLVSVKRVGPGYRIIARFETTDGRRILLDRGFVRTSAKDTPRQTGPMQVTGNLHWPQEVDGFTPDPDPSGNIWFAREVPQLAQALGTEPVLIIAKSQTDPGVTPIPVDTAGVPNDHLNYAITWFSLALIWVVMIGVFLWRARAKTERPDISGQESKD